MLLRVVLFFCAVYQTSSSENFPIEEITVVPEASVDTTNYRLPTTLKPTHYEIRLEPFFDPDFTFDGEVIIDIDVLQDTSKIIIHGWLLTITKDQVQVKLQNGVNYITVNSLDFDSTTRFYTIELNEELKAGEAAVLEIKYTGVLNEENNGFYRASYEEDGVTKWFATTHFEPYRARQAFPCFDEPALKATFKIKIVRPATYNSISNMDIETSTLLDDGRYEDTFKTSVEMSTYLVAFVVSEMTSEKLENQAVYAAQKMIEEGRGKFAVKTGIEVIKAIEDFTDVTYSLDKMYQVAIPDKDFSPGAMENWGLVTYKQQYLLYKDGKTTSSEKERIVSIIAHEFGHQWFGNLVGPSWWEYIWLNEGFATYFEYYAASIVDPSMRMMEQFVTGTLEYAFESDGLETTRPMSSPAATPSEISSLFDRVAYDKSGSVIRMMEHFLSTSVFQKGLNIYLNAKKFDAASPIDLWNAMQNAEPLYLPATVAVIMETWNSQAGYPVVTAGRSEGGLITLTQSRFLLHKTNHDDESTWFIPINLARGKSLDFSDTTAMYWLAGRTEETNILLDDGEFFILNKQQTGYYRVNYDEDNWNSIIDYLNTDQFDKIHVLNRAQLIDDSFTLARSGRLDFEVPLRLSTYLRRESDYIPLHSFFRSLQFLNNHLAGSSGYELFKTFVKELLQKAYETLGGEATGDHTTLKNRITVINWLCRFEDDSCTQDMHDKLNVLDPTNSDLHPDLETPVYCGGLRSAININMKWTRLYYLYSQSTTESLQRSRVLSGMGCTFNVIFLQRLLSMAVDQAPGFTLNPDDRTAAFSAVYTGSDVGLNTAFDYVLENFQYLKSALTRSQISSIVSGIASRVSSSEQLAKLQQFAEAQSAEDQLTYRGVFDSAVSTIQTNIDWFDTYVPSIITFLETYYSDETTSTQTDSTPTSEPTTPTIETTTPDGASFIMASLSLLVGTIILHVVA